MITSSRSPISPTSVDQVVEHPGRVERVHARPQRGAAEVDLAADLHEPLARGLLAVGGHGVLEVAEQDVGRRRDVGQLRGHLLVRRVEEVDHPRGRDRDLEQRIGGADGERLGEVTGIAHAGATLAPAASVAPHIAEVAGSGHMSSETNRSVETDQAAREASGAHPYGRYLEEFEVGRGLQALAGQDRDRGRRPPVLPDHDEPPPAAHQRRLRARSPSRAATSSSGRWSTRSRSA